MKPLIRVVLICVFFGPPAFSLGGAQLVMTAAADIKKGAVLSAGDIEYKKIPAGDLQKGYISGDEAVFFTGSQTAPFKVLADIPEGAQITKNLLVSQNKEAGLLKPGLRLYPVGVSAADFNIFTPGSYAEIRIAVADGWVLFPETAFVAGRQRFDGKHFLYIALSPMAAQWLFAAEQNAAVLNFALVKGGI
jgi:hypothetical protein